MTEQFVDILGYEGLYKISNRGVIFSMITNKPLSQNIHYKNGYASVNLKGNGKSKRFLVHRIVAKHFIPNPHNLPEVNHKDHNRINNNINNLEWTDRVNNVHYSILHDRNYKMPIVAISNDGNKLNFNSIKECAIHIGTDSSTISAILKNKYGRKTARGYRFEIIKPEVTNDLRCNA